MEQEAVAKITIAIIRATNHYALNYLHVSIVRVDNNNKATTIHSHVKLNFLLFTYIG